MQLDHLAITVADVEASKQWYVSVLGLAVEFETGTAVGLKDDGDFTLILTEGDRRGSLCAMYFQVADVVAIHAELVARGVAFRHPPQDNHWGYGAGLSDPDGRVVGLWDQKSMQEHARR